MSELADRQAAVAFLTQLSPEDQRQIHAMTDASDVIEIVESYALANQHVDRSVVGQVTAFFAGMSPADWKAFLVVLVPYLVPLL